MNIKNLREKRGLSQSELAKQLNIQQSTVSMWETGRAMPRASLMPKLAKILKCTVSKLFEEVG